METKNPLVSVVIPTRNRPELILRALNGVLNQTLRDIEVTVVIDGPDKETESILSRLDDPRLKIVMLSRNMGLPSARNAGVSASQGKWVAFLDDDDEWLHDKLELQLQTAQKSHNRYPIVTCQVIGRSEFGDLVLPRRFPNSSEYLSEYLFCRRSIFWGEALLPFCTIFTTKELLVKEPFRTDLKRHEDLEWLLRVSKIEGVSIEPVPVSDPLVILHIEENRSRMSNEPDWRYSLSWIQSNMHLVTIRAYKSFLMTWLSSNAARQRDWKAFLLLLRETLKYGLPSAMDTLLYVGIWLIPREKRKRIATYLGY